MKYEEIESTIEAILFASGDGVEVELLSRALELDAETCEAVLSRMMAHYNAEPRGLAVVKMDKTYQLCTRTEYFESIKQVIDRRREMPLSTAALEVLAITAYNQPVTRAFIEQVRGVDSNGIVQQLAEKNLIEERGRLDVPGKPMTFGTTAEFLRIFCLSGLSELPPIEEEGLFGQIKMEEKAQVQNS